MNYQEFLAAKSRIVAKAGFQAAKMPKFLRADQRFVTGNALEAGKYAIFADCGLGKTFDELEFASQVAHKGPVLIVAPLCVSVQTQQMGKEHGYEVHHAKTPEDMKDGINITNYERLEKFEDTIPELAGIILDESSILKSIDGKMRSFILRSFRRTPYRLACTATPAPNDHMELGNHAEFLGVCLQQEMLANYFTHDGGDTAKWRLKGHAVKPFWAWVAQWSSTYRRPSDLDPKFSDEGFDLPELLFHKHILHSEIVSGDMLFDMGNVDLKAHREIRRKTISKRIGKCAELKADNPGPWVFWCELNDEADSLVDEIPGSEQLKGADSIDRKEEILWAFTRGQLKTLITKYRITSFGLNWQHCNQTAFVGATYSYEQTYQAIKRFHRFGQTKPVHAHFVMADQEFSVHKILMDKFAKHEQFKEATCT